MSRRIPQLVVGVALLESAARGRRVLAARRTRPPALAGRWELPGGKCQDGESPEVAAVRELEEELGCVVRVTGRLAGSQPIEDHLELVVVTAELVRGEPVPREHQAVRWLRGDELDAVLWLTPDVPFLAELRQVLEEAVVSGTVRAVFFEEEHAATVAARLAADGFAAEMVRERLAGEDDDLDHPWAVLTDAPEYVVELWADRFDGWLDVR